MSAASPAASPEIVALTLTRCVAGSVGLSFDIEPETGGTTAGPQVDYRGVRGPPAGRARRPCPRRKAARHANARRLAQRIGGDASRDARRGRMIQINASRKIS